MKNNSTRRVSHVPDQQKGNNHLMNTPMSNLSSEKQWNPDRITNITSSNHFSELNNADLQYKYQQCVELIKAKDKEIDELKSALQLSQNKQKNLKDKLLKCQQLKDKYLKSRNEWKHIS